MASTYPFAYDYKSSRSISTSPDGVVKINLGRRPQALMGIPALLFVWGLTIAMIWGFVWGLTEHRGNDEDNIPNLRYLVPAALLILGLTGMCLFWTWEVMQDLFRRRLVIDSRANQATLEVMPCLRRKFALAKVQTVQIWWAEYKGKHQSIVALQLRGRRSVVRLIDGLSGFSAPELSFIDSIRPFAESIAQHLGGVPLKESPVSVWRMFWVWGH